MTRTVGGARIRRTDRPFTSRTQPLGAPYELLPIASVARAVADHALQSRDLGALRTLVGSAVGRRQCSVPDLLAEYEGGPRKHSKLLRGRLLYVVDLLWRELRAALEIDSREYHFGIEDWEATLDRHNELTRYGLAVTHYAPRRVTCRGSTFVPDVADWLRRRALELHIPLPAGHGVRRPPADEATPPFVINTGNP